MLLHDRAPVTSRHVDARGMMTATARLSRVGVQRYLRQELGLVGNGEVGVWRDASQVLSDSSLATFRGAVMTMGHPPSGVSARNWRSVAIGHVLDAGRDPDGIHVAATVRITSAEAVAAVQAGTAALSVGYVCDLKPRVGVSPLGERFEYEQTNIVADHVAVLPAGTARCGASCVIADGAFAASSGQCACGGTCNTNRRPIVSDTVRTVIVDGLPITTDATSAAAIERLQGRLAFYDGMSARYGIAADQVPHLLAAALGRAADRRAEEARKSIYRQQIIERGGQCI